MFQHRAQGKRVSNLVALNRVALVLVALIVVSTLVMISGTVNCRIAGTIVGINIFAAIAAVILVLMGMIQTMASKQQGNVPSVLCLVAVILLCGAMAPFNLMVGIGAGHCYG